MESLIHPAQGLQRQIKKLVYDFYDKITSAFSQHPGDWSL